MCGQNFHKTPPNCLYTNAFRAIALKEKSILISIKLHQAHI